MIERYRLWTGYLYQVLFLGLAGVIILASGFQIEKADDKTGWTLNGKWFILLKYQNLWFVKSGWVCIILGFILQIIRIITI